MGVATVDDLRPIIDAWVALTWPATAETATEFVERVGWERTRERGANTTLPVSWRHASLHVDGDEFRGVDFAVSVGDDDDPDVDARLKADYASVGSALAEILGPADRTTGGKTPRRRWELESGGRIILERHDAMVAIGLESKWEADISRGFERHGRRG